MGKWVVGLIFSYFPKSEILKIFWAVKFNHEEAVKAMVDYHKWRVESLPIRPTDKGIEMIVSHILYQLFIRAKDS
jgi:hypothetical protein